MIRAALYGGASYGDPSSSFPVSDLDTVRRMWLDRRDSNGLRTCDDIDAYGDAIRVFYPCWGDRPASAGDERWLAAQVWIVPERDKHLDPERHDPFGTMPDYRLTVGPRGGLRWERCV